MKRLRPTVLLLLSMLVMLVVIAGCDRQEEELKTTKDTQSQAEESEIAPTTIRVSSLKGPTSIGLAGVMQAADKQELHDTYDFQISGAADEIVAKLASGETDIALLPANVAATLYAKGQEITVININTLGVLYAVSQDESIESIKDLKGKTVYLSGKGTTPDFVFSYLLAENGLSEDEVTVEFKSEPTEVAALIASDASAVGILPEPYADSIGLENENLQTRIDLTKAWDDVQDFDQSASQLVTAVTVVRNEFARENPEAVDRFLENHRQSVDFVINNVADAARIVSDKSIIPNQDIAETIIPKCNIVFIADDEMKSVLEGYLQVLFDADPSSVGGVLPSAEFYDLN